MERRRGFNLGVEVFSWLCYAVCVTAMATTFSYVGEVNFVDVFLANLFFGINYFFDSRKSMNTRAYLSLGIFCLLSTYLPAADGLIYVFNLAGSYIWMRFIYTYGYPCPGVYILDLMVILLVHHYGEKLGASVRMLTFVQLLNTIVKYNRFQRKSLVDIILLPILLYVWNALNDQMPVLCIATAHVWFTSWTFIQHAFFGI